MELITFHNICKVASFSLYEIDVDELFNNIVIKWEHLWIKWRMKHMHSAYVYVIIAVMS